MPPPPELAWSDVELLTVTNFYDYPRSGSLRWRGERFYFSETFDALTEARLALVELTSAEWKAFDARDALFRKHVAQYDYAGNRLVRRVIQPQSQHRAFYDAVEPFVVPRRDPVAVLVMTWDVDEDDE